MAFTVHPLALNDTNFSVVLPSVCKVSYFDNAAEVRHLTARLERIETKLFVEFAQNSNLTIKCYKPDFGERLLAQVYGTSSLQQEYQPAAFFAGPTCIAFSGNSPTMAYMNVLVNPRGFETRSTKYTMNAIFFSGEATRTILNSFENSFIRDMEELYR